MTVIVWDRALLRRFKVALAKAVKENKRGVLPSKIVFTFQGHEFVASYALYLIEYLEATLPKR